MNILKPHVSLNVSNIDASVAFYEKVFGVDAPPSAAPATRSSTSQSAVAEPHDAGGAAHGRQRQPLRRPGREHRRRRRGVDALQGGRAQDARPRRTPTCCYALQDKVWVEDPGRQLVGGLRREGRRARRCRTSRRRRLLRAARRQRSRQPKAERWLLRLDLRMLAEQPSPRRSGRRCCSRPSSARASWASSSRAGTSRSRCWPTRSRRARGSSRSS